MSNQETKRGVTISLKIEDAPSNEFARESVLAPALEGVADVKVGRYTTKEARQTYHWQEYLLSEEKRPKLGGESSTWLRTGYSAWYLDMNAEAYDYIPSAEADPITGLLNTESTVGIEDSGHRVISTHFVGGASLMHEGVLRTDFQVELTNDKFSTSGISVLGDTEGIDLDGVEVGRVDATHRRGNVDGISVIRPDQETHGFITIKGQIETIWFEQGVDISRVRRNGGDPIVQLNGQTDLVFEDMSVREVKNLVKPYM